MVFCIIFFVVSVLTLIGCLIWEQRNENGFTIITGVLSGIIAFVLLIVLIGYPIKSTQLENKINQMRATPEGFSVQDASSANKVIIDIAYWQGTIFTWHKNFDTTLLNLDNYKTI